ncbi:MAG: hypothetical protein HXL30_01175 [Prevotellaceae bacterium]|jgi:hypothetical protein|nr:hypothetical protein [Prevotellaceae bacterium]
MTKRKELFQTLEQRCNVDDVENNGPYCCKREDAWLSEGYYFWEHIDFAHAWGNLSYGGNYMIGSLCIEYKDEDLLDLSDSDDLCAFEKAYEMLSCKFKTERITVAFVVKFLREKTDVSWKAVKAIIERSFNVRKFSALEKGIPVSTNRYSQQLNLRPQIQWCVIERSLLKDTPFSVVFDSDISPQAI